MEFLTTRANIIIIRAFPFEGGVMCPYGVVYKTTNLINGKIYIGKTIKTGNKLKCYFGSGVSIIHAIKKYGINNFKKDIMAEASSEDELNALEIYYIKEYNSMDIKIGYNILQGGEGFNSKTASETSKKMWRNPVFREKISKSIKESYKNPEIKARKKIIMEEISRRDDVNLKKSIASKKMWEDEAYKKKVSNLIKISKNTEESKRGTSLFQKEYKNREDVKREASKKQKERMSNPDIREKMSKFMKEFANRPEQKEKQSVLSKKIWDNEELREKRSIAMSGGKNPAAKKIIATNTKTNEQIIFDSGVDCAKYFNKSNSLICAILSNRKPNKFIDWNFSYSHIVKIPLY